MASMNSPKIWLGPLFHSSSQVRLIYRSLLHLFIMDRQNLCAFIFAPRNRST